MRGNELSLLNLCPTASAMGGVARIAAYTGALLEDHGWDVRTVFPGGSDDVSLKRWSDEYGIELATDSRFIPETHRFTAAGLAAMRSFARESRARVAIVHLGTQSIPPRLVFALRAAGVPHCFAYCHAAYPWAGWGDQRLTAMRNTRLASYLCRGVIACSDPVAHELDEAGVPIEKMTVINTGVRLRTNFSDRAEARAALGLPNDAFVIASVLRFAPEKAPDVLVRAVAALSSDPLLVMQGEGDLKPEIERLAKDALGGRAWFYDKSSDVSALYAACDVFALTSLNEGFPLVLQEAAVHGRPVVATDVGGVRQLVEDGVTGCVVPPADDTAVTEALTWLMAEPDERDRMGREARKRAESKFSDVLTVERVDRFLRSMLDVRA